MGRIALLGELEQMVLLAILRLEEEANAVSIHQEILACTGLKPAIGSIYVTLDRLERKGHLASFFARATPGRGTRNRRFFTVERSAIEALQRSRQAFRSLWEGLDPDSSHAEG